MAVVVHGWREWISAFLELNPSLRRDKRAIDIAQYSYNAGFDAARETESRSCDEGHVIVPVKNLKKWASALAEELAAYDISPPIAHLEEAHNEICDLIETYAPCDVNLRNTQSIE